MNRGVVSWSLIGAAAIGMAVACIIPDRDIQVRTTDFNLYPVRFVEGIPLSEEARCACNADVCECPLPDSTALPTFLDPAEYPFCVCNENRFDFNRLPKSVLYVEDQDEVDGAPDDQLYAAALLDWSPTLGEPATDYIAYRNYLDPTSELNLASLFDYENLVIKRPRPYVRQIELQVDDAFDLCNGAGQPLEPGFHTITFIVTDRPWYRRTTDGGMVVTIEAVPDIAAGATYDIQTYVFSCLPEGDTNCGCMDVAP